MFSVILHNAKMSCHRESVSVSLEKLYKPTVFFGFLTLVLLSYNADIYFYLMSIDCNISEKYYKLPLKDIYLCKVRSL